MASELIVQTLKGPTSGANANKVIIPAGQTLELTGNASGLLTEMPTGSVINSVYAQYEGEASFSAGSMNNYGNSNVYYIHSAAVEVSITKQEASSVLKVTVGYNFKYDANSGMHGFIIYSNNTGTIYEQALGHDLARSTLNSAQYGLWIQGSAFFSSVPTGSITFRGVPMRGSNATANFSRNKNNSSDQPASADRISFIQIEEIAG